MHKRKPMHTRNTTVQPVRTSGLMRPGFQANA